MANYGDNRDLFKDIQCGSIRADMLSKAIQRF